MEAFCCEFRAAGTVIRQYDFLARTCRQLQCCPHFLSGTPAPPVPLPSQAEDWHDLENRFEAGAVIFGAVPAASDNPQSGRDHRGDRRCPGSHLLHGVLSRSRQHAQAISIVRPTALPAFDSDAARRLEPLLAHLSRAHSLGQSIDAQLHERFAFMALLQHIPFACLLVNQLSYVRFINEAAAAMLVGGGELRVIADRLCGRTLKSSDLLWRAVSQTAAIGDGATGEVSLALPHDTEDVPLVLKLFSIQQDTSGASRRPEAMVAVIAKNPMGAAFTPLGRLCEAYGLTRAESRLIGQLSNGSGLFETARRIGISRNTARTHMRNIYAKLNVHDQLNLMRLLGRFGAI
jgi:DNA-binding CsgD family transcriptional regulator